jgi:hypothetical protein
MDRDTVRGRYDLERLLARLHSGEINLLVGTQMIAKGTTFTASRWWAWWAATIALDAGLPRRRAGVSADDAGLRAAPAAAICRGAWWCRLTIPTTTRLWRPARTTTRALWSAN